MKYLAICALLLPLVYGAAVPQPNRAEADLVPDMSTAKDGFEMALVPDMSVASDGFEPTNNKRQLPLFSFMSRQLGGAPASDARQVPDMSVAADAGDFQNVKVNEAQADANVDLVPDMSVAADAGDQVAEKAVLVPDMSVASDAL